MEQAAVNFAAQNDGIFTVNLRRPYAAKAFENMLKRAGFMLTRDGGRELSLVEAAKKVGLRNTVSYAPDSEAFYSVFTPEEGEEMYRVMKREKEAAKRHQASFFFGANREVVQPESPKSEIAVRDADPTPTGFSQALCSTMLQIGVPCEVQSENIGPSFHSLHVIPQQGVKVSKVLASGPDLSVRLGRRVRIVQDPNTSRLMVEIPRENRTFPSFRSVMQDATIPADMELPMVIGSDVGGESVVMDLAEMPHLLVCGTTGSGKSVMVKAMIASLVANRPDTGLIISDPKRVEMRAFQNHPSMMGPVMTETSELLSVLNSLCNEMERRFTVLESADCTDIASFRRKGGKMPYLVLVIDELADIMMSAKKAAEPLLVRLAQKARAAGIHMVLCTQRPSVDVVTGLLKSNIPARIALRCSSATDSRVAIDADGAESLLGKGDAIVRAKGSEIRVQAPFISNEDI